MKHIYRLFILLLIIAGVLSACAPKASTEAEGERPARLEPIEGTDLNRVMLTERAAERLDIQMASVSEQQITRKRTVGGTVVLPLEASATNTDATYIEVWVRVPLTESDLNQIDRDQPTLVLPEGVIDKTAGLTAQIIAEKDRALYYALDAKDHSLTLGQHVQIELTLSGSGTQRQMVPYDAVVYGPNGETWVFVSTEPLTFFRYPVSIEYIEGGLAVLSEGPATGTQVVTVGAAELFGSELEFAEE